MNLLCPNCQKMITVPDHYAGQMMKCPLCAESFPAPSLPGSMAGSASEAAPLAGSSNPAPPGYNPKDEGSFKNPSDASPRWESASAASSGEKTEPFSSTGPGPLPGDYRHRYTIWVSPRVVTWIAPVGLVLILFLLFFYWRSVPTEIESAMKEKDPDFTVSQRGWVKVTSNAWLILYLLLYLVTLALAVGSLLLNLKVIAPPPQLKPVLPWRSALIGGLALLGLLFLIFGSMGEDFPTFWFGFTAWIQFAVLIGSGLEFCLEYRGPDRPLPKIDILW